MDLDYKGENIPVYGSQFSDRKSGGLVSSAAMKRPSAVVKLSDDYNVFPAGTANVNTT